ncbi:hypothetical protein Sinac_2522 [Singulisphaera acidiphila DSM 18658]|uniref:Uncharacterized protein n=1 Tax=Singulisphaera acidiphila (strain ATCC BAA-1392 / DSM 18658 / VKM B-2454 / MOB10) TaxID=886293 RepID=L0DBT5_SINAD|nr:hypothetical protein Sinac_2522 [Singulisphaera acidiphila DSM 18658]
MVERGEETDEEGRHAKGMVGCSDEADLFVKPRVEEFQLHGLLASPISLGRVGGSSPASDTLMQSRKSTDAAPADAVGALNLSWWARPLIEVWGWSHSARMLSDRPWDDAGQRPAHADRRRPVINSRESLGSRRQELSGRQRPAASCSATSFSTSWSSARPCASFARILPSASMT